MRFSIIIPAYNAEKTLGKCIQSVRNQTFQDYEAIVINDGSTDRTEEMCQKIVMKDQRFRYFRQENAGVSAARNIGIEMALGEFLVFLDSDDQFDKGYLFMMNQMILLDPDGDNFWCGYTLVSTNGAELGVRKWNLASDEVEHLDRWHIMDYQDKGLVAPLWNKVFRKDIVEKHHLRMDESLSLGEDLIFNYEYLDVCKPEIMMMCLPLYCYTDADDGSLDSKYRHDLKEILEKLDSINLHYLIKWNVSEEQMNKFNKDVFWHYDRVLHNTYSWENKSRNREKKRYNISIMKSEKFQQSLKNVKTDLHPLYWLAYQKGYWNILMGFEYMSKIKRRIRKKRLK